MVDLDHVVLDGVFGRHAITIFLSLDAYSVTPPLCGVAIATPIQKQG